MTEERDIPPRELIALLTPLRQRLTDHLHYPDPTLRFGSAQLMVDRLPRRAQEEGRRLVRLAIAEHEANVERQAEARARSAARRTDDAPGLMIALNALGGFTLTLRSGQEIVLAEGPGLHVQLRALLGAAQPSAAAACGGHRTLLSGSEPAPWTGQVQRLPARGATKPTLALTDLDDLL